MRGQFTMTEGWDRALTDEEAEAFWGGLLGPPTSYWEVVIKTQKGLLAISDLATWWRQATELTAGQVHHPSLALRASFGWQAKRANHQAKDVHRSGAASVGAAKVDWQAEH